MKDRVLEYLTVIPLAVAGVLIMATIIIQLLRWL